MAIDMNNGNCVNQNAANTVWTDKDGAPKGESATCIVRYTKRNCQGTKRYHGISVTLEGQSRKVKQRCISTRAGQGYSYRFVKVSVIS